MNRIPRREPRMRISVRNVAVASSISCLLVPGLLIPILEVNATHLFHPDWPSHARLHEAWQLITNGFLAWAGIVIGFRDGGSRIPHCIGLVISTSFICAWLMRDSYGGSMGDASTSSMALAGLDIAVVVMALVSFLHLFGLLGSRSIRSGADPMLKGAGSKR